MKGFNVMVWIAPVLVGLLSIGILVIYLKTPQAEPESVTFTPSDILFDDEIERELKELD
jgi:cytochrome c-type biogenesis protein CcmH/NrfF